VHFPLSVSNWNCLCIFNFSNTFPLSHLSRCLSVHLPPPFTHNTNHAARHFAILFKPLTHSLSSDQISNSASGLAQHFKCLILWNTNTNTHHPIHLYLYGPKCLFTSPNYVWILSHFYEKLLGRYARVLDNLSSGDVTKCVVISNNESSAAYCHSRRRSTDTSSDSQLRTVLWWAHWWSHQNWQPLWKSQFCHRCHNSARVFFILSQINPEDTLPCSF